MVKPNADLTAVSHLKQPNGHPNIRPRANPSIVLREEFENHAFLYDPDTGESLPLNPVGAYIWKHLDGRRSIQDIIDSLDEEFENVSPKAAAHLKTFLEDLKDRGFIE